MKTSLSGAVVFMTASSVISAAQAGVPIDVDSKRVDDSLAKIALGALTKMNTDQLLRQGSVDLVQNMTLDGGEIMPESIKVAVAQSGADSTNVHEINATSCHTNCHSSRSWR